MTKGKKKLDKKALKKGMGIGAVAMRAILDGKDVEQTIAAVKRAYPKASTGRNSVLWYRSELKRRGEKVPALARTNKEEAKAPKKKARRTIASLNIAAAHRPAAAQAAV